MRRLLLVCMMVVGLLAMATCGGGSSREATAIEDTIRGYLAAYNAEEFGTCLTYFTDFGSEQAALDSLRWMRGFLGEVAPQKIEDIAISGKTATATVTVIIWGEPDTDQMHFKKLNGVWKIVWAQQPTPPPQIPAERRLPGTIETAPELQGVVELEHCLWFGEDGGLNFWYQIQNTGDQALRLSIEWGVYNAQDELVSGGGLEWNIDVEPGRWTARSARWTPEDVATQVAAHYKMTVEGAAAAEFSAIEDTIRGYLEAYNAEDFDTCLTYLPRSIDRQVVLDSLSWMRGYFGEVNVHWWMGAQPISVSGETATAPFYVTALGEEWPDSIWMELRKENGVWKLEQSRGSWFPTLTPTQGFLPGTVDIDPLLQGAVRIKHCSWFEVDGVLWYWHRVWNTGGQTVGLCIKLEAYNAEGQVFYLGGTGGSVEPGESTGECAGHGAEGLLTATHYKIIVTSYEDCL